MGEEVKVMAARLIGAASPDEVVPMAGTAMGINTAAASLPLRAGDNVLVLEGDYPANIYPWLNQAHRGVLVKWVPTRGGGLDLDLLAARIDRRTRVVALSSVMFATGFKNNLAAVEALCRERGIYVVVDGIQSLGAFPLDVRECGIDMLACGSQKWLLSAPGSGFFYCRRAILDDLAPGAYVGATSTVDPFNFLDYNFTLLPSALAWARRTSPGWSRCTPRSASCTRSASRTSRGASSRSRTCSSTSYSGATTRSSQTGRRSIAAAS